MILHFLVEGPSEEKLLRQLLPRLIPKHVVQIHPHQGKGRLTNDPREPSGHLRRGLLDQLPAKLRAFGKQFSHESERVIVLLDADSEDCQELLKKLNALLKSIKPAPVCLFRLAIEETEAWYLGDWKAIKTAFPKAKRVERYKDYKQDTVCGTWELFGEVIGDRAERKIFWAEQMGQYLSVEKGGASNGSHSFRKFCEGVRRLAGETDTPILRARRVKSVATRKKANRKR